MALDGPQWTEGSKYTRDIFPKWVMLTESKPASDTYKNKLIICYIVYIKPIHLTEYETTALQRAELCSLSLWWMTDVTKLLAATVRKGSVSISQLHIFSIDKRELNNKLKLKANQFYHYLQIKKNESTVSVPTPHKDKVAQHWSQGVTIHRETLTSRLLKIFPTIAAHCLSVFHSLSFSLSLSGHWVDH